MNFYLILLKIKVCSRFQQTIVTTALIINPIRFVHDIKNIIWNIIRYLMRKLQHFWFSVHIIPVFNDTCIFFSHLSTACKLLCMHWYLQVVELLQELSNLEAAYFEIKDKWTNISTIDTLIQLLLRVYYH